MIIRYGSDGHGVRLAYCCSKASHTIVCVFVCVCVYVSVCECLCAYVCLCVCMWVSLFLCVSVCVSMCACLSVCECLYVYVCLCVCVWVSVFLCVLVFPCVRVCVSMCACVSVCECLCVSVLVCLCMVLEIETMTLPWLGKHSLCARCQLFPMTPFTPYFESGCYSVANSGQGVTKFRTYLWSPGVPGTCHPVTLLS